MLSHPAWPSSQAPPSLSVKTGNNPENMEVFVVSKDNVLYHTELRTEISAWTGWDKHLYGAPSVKSVATGFSGHLEVFAVGTDSTLFHLSWKDDFGNPPPVASIATGKRRTSDVNFLDVFAVGTDNSIWYNSRPDQDGSWGTWIKDFGDRPGNPAPKVTAFTCECGDTGNLEVFAVGVDGWLYHNFSRSSWNEYGWNEYGWMKGPFPVGNVGKTVKNVVASKRSATNDTPEQMHLFVVCTDGTLGHTWMEADGVWKQWEKSFNTSPEEALLVTDVATGVAVTSQGFLEVFAVGIEGTLFHTWLNNDGKGSWAPWRSWSQTNFKSVSTGTAPNGDLQVFAIGMDDELIYHNWLDGIGWHDWHRF